MCTSAMCVRSVRINGSRLECHDTCVIFSFPPVPSARHLNMCNACLNTCTCDRDIERCYCYERDARFGDVFHNVDETGVIPPSHCLFRLTQPLVATSIMDNLTYTCIHETTRYILKRFTSKDQTSCEKRNHQRDLQHTNMNVSSNRQVHSV